LTTATFPIRELFQKSARITSYLEKQLTKLKTFEIMLQYSISFTNSNQNGLKLKIPCKNHLWFLYYEDRSACTL